MSSPAGQQHSQADFLAQWMPSSTRAGVILNPCPDLAGSLRHISTVGPMPLEPDDSFASDFAPLPASADSSCLGVDRYARTPGGESGGAESSINDACAQVDTLYEMAGNTLDMPLVMKLEQLRKWQQHMQEQLKAHQLEELLRLQEEQQRLLGMMNASQHHTRDTSELSGAEWEEESVELQQNPCSPGIHCQSVPHGSNRVLEKEQHLSEGQDHEGVDDNITSVWHSREEDEAHSVEISFHDHTVKPRSGVNTKEGVEDGDFSDRPIKPGIGGQKQSFEELLEEQLRLEEQRLKSAQTQGQSQDGNQPVPAVRKRPFLKRGEGLSRFNNNRKVNLPKTEGKKDFKPHSQTKAISRSNSEPASTLKSGLNSVQRVPVQRKTATLNKENQPRGSSSLPQDIRVDSKTSRTKVLGSHQRQNTAGPVSVQTDVEDKRIKQHLGQGKELTSAKCGPTAPIVRKPELHSMQPNPVTKQVGLGRAEHNAADDTSVERKDGSRASVGGVQQESFELSFQDKLHRWECDQQLESMELGEFELLEQAAEELSFSSNSSFVTKVLQMDQQHRQLHHARGLHQRRLSSTPIKSPPREVLRRSGSVGSSVSASSKSSFVCSQAPAMKRSEGTSQNQDSAEVTKGQDAGTEDESEAQELLVNAALFPSTLCFPEQSNPPYDKRSYQDEDSCKDSDETRDDDSETDGVLSAGEESTLVEDKDGQQRRVVFDDDDTWNDLEDASVGLPSDSSVVSPVSKVTANVVAPPERTLLRKVAVTKVVALDGAKVTANLEPNPPPASQLMTRLFPSLKPKTQSAPPPPPPPPPPPASSVAPESKNAVEESGQQVQSRQLRERLVELEIEIERFKKENAALIKLRQENEKTQEALRKERLEFEQMKTEEMSKFEEYKKEETRKLQRERKLFEKHSSAARAIPDKKEREEIQALKQQVSSLQEELKRKESRWSSTHGRQRQQIDSLTQEINALRDEIRTLERLRISALKKNTVGAEKNMREDLTDKPALSAVTKGVKFASPLDSRGGGSSSSSSSSSSSPPQISPRDGSQGPTGTVPAAGMKSSLRRPAGSASSSPSVPSLPGRRTEERPPPVKSQEQVTKQLSTNCSSKRDLLKEPELRDVREEPEAVQVITHPDGKTENVLAGGDRLIVFPNGTKKEMSADGLTVKVTFFNGDTKQITADQRVIYYYADAQTTHVTYPDGMEVLHFPNNQTEKHFPDGHKEITFPDQTVKNLFPDGREESVLNDGTIIKVNPDGTKEILFNTGQKEIHTADYKRREYPDGTVKTVYSDGRQETRYPNGRLRIKDRDGNVTLDRA